MPVKYLITPRACTGVKQFGLSVSLSVVTTKIARSRNLGVWATCKHNQSVEISENWLDSAFNRLARAMNVTNSVCLLTIVAMPIDCAHCTAGHVLSAHVHNWPGRDCQYCRSH